MKHFVLENKRGRPLGRSLIAGVTALVFANCAEPNQPMVNSSERSRPEFAPHMAPAIWLSTGGSSLAYDVNGDGVVVGQDDYYLPVRWTTRGRTDLPGLDPASPYGVAYGINELGQVAGASTTVEGATHATLWSADGVAADLGVLAGGTYSIANAISETGQVVGYADNREHADMPVSWRPGSPAQRLRIWPGHVAGYATAVNDLGAIVGYSLDTDGIPHAILWTPGGGMVDLGANAYAWGINNQTVIVGDDRSAGFSVPFRWTPANGLEHLPLRCDCGAAGYSINDRGVIVGAQTSGYGLIAVLWTPTLKVVHPDGINSLAVQAMAVSACGHIVGQVDDEWAGSYAILWPGGECAPLPTPSSVLEGSRLNRDHPARRDGQSHRDWSLPRAPRDRRSK